MNSINALVVRYCPTPEYAKTYSRTLEWLGEKGIDILTYDNTPRNIGLTAARNILVNISQADVVVLMDFDLKFGPMDFEAMAQKAMEPDIGLVMPRTEGIGKEEPQDWQPIKRPQCSCIVIERALLFEIGGLDERYFIAYADWDLLNRLEERGLRVLQHNQSRIREHYGLSRATKGKRAIWAKDRAVYQQQYGKKWR